MVGARRITPWGVSLFIVGLHASLYGQKDPINWQPGPKTVDLGDGIAELTFPSGYVFADASTTRRIMELNGNKPSNRELGLIAPAQEHQNWFITFEFDPIGYVSDEDKNKIDADAILESIRKGTEAANEFRKQKGFPLLHVTGWNEKPHYAQDTHNLVWALQAKEEGTNQSVVNYDTRLLGRSGVMSVTLVSDPGSLDQNRPQVVHILKGFSYKTGHRYAEYIKGDKLAGYGLTALVAGGAGLAAAKFGLLAWLGKFLVKAWKLVVIAAAGLAASLKRAFRAIFKKKDLDINNP